MNAVQVTVHPDPVSAEIVRSTLLDAGFHPLPVKQAGHLALYGADQGFSVWVPEEELQSAVDLIKASGDEKFLW